MLRRLGYVRLRDYNLRATSDGLLVPISSDRPVPLDLTHPLVAGPRWPPPQPPQLAEGTFDGLDAVEGPRHWVDAPTTQHHSAGPPPRAPAPFGGEDEDDELPYVPWTEDT